MTVINPNMAATFPPPVMEARRWIDGVTFPADRPLINVSQAAPVDPPPPRMRAAMAEIIERDDAAHLYGPVLGLPELRCEIARQWAGHYGGQIGPDRVAITSGCNQAFAAAIATLAAPGDAVILPTPWYFNHKMWLEMAGVEATPLPTQHDLLPDPDHARSLITDRTRAIVLVSPNNPGGVEYPAALLRRFADLCRQTGLQLIVDETYRDFDSRTGAAHDLFSGPDWDDVLIQLYSFSKAYRLTGHRVGAMVASTARLAEVEKFLDTVAICPNQLGQRAALWGMQHLGDWLGTQRAEILARRTAIQTAFPKLAPHGWQLRGCGAYFAYMIHPFDLRSDALAQRLVHEAGVLCLPGTMFVPEGDPGGDSALRIAFANIDAAGIEELFDRLASLGSTLLPR